MEHEDHRREFAAAVVAHTIACYAGKQLKEGAQLAYGDFMPSQRSKLESARRKAMAESVRDYFHGLAKDKGLA
jgi:hypothetical protein